MIFKTTTISNPNKRGSVGKYISNPNPGIISESGIDNGAKNAMRYTILSKEKITTSSMAKINGNTFIAIVSLFTTKKTFNRIKLIVMR